MASLGRAVLELATDPAKLHEGLGEAKAKTGEWGEHVGGIAGTATMAIAAVGAAVLGAAAGLVAMGESAASTAGEVRKLSRETGLTAEQASELRFAANKLGIDSDGLSKSFGIFSKGLENNSKAMIDNGVVISRTKDGHIDLEKTLGSLADRFREMPNGVEKTGMAMELFGKSGKDMIPLLNQGSEGLKEMGDEAHRMGLVFSAEGVESARQMGLAQKGLEERVEGVKNTIGMAVIPVLLALFTHMSEIADVVGPAVVEIFGRIQTVFAAFGDIIGVVTGKTPAAGAAMKALVGDAANPLMAAVAGVREAFASMSATITAVVAWLRAQIMPFVGSVVDAFSEFWGNIQPKVNAAMTSIGEKVTWVINTIIVPIVTYLAQFWRDHFEQISAVVSAAFVIIQRVFFIAFDIITGVFTVFLDLLSGNWSGAWDDMVGMLRSVWDEISGIFDSLGEIGANLINIALSLGRDIVNGILDGLGALKDRVWSAITSAITSAIASININLGPIHFSGSSGFSMDMPHFAGGTDYVPRTGMAIVHEGERIITAADNAAGRFGGSAGNAGHGHDIVMDGVLVARAVGRQTMRGAQMAGAPIG